MTRQAISRQISRLEQDLDVMLFVRGTRNVQLTEGGLRFYELFSVFADEVTKLRDEFSQNSSETDLHIGFIIGVDLHPALNGLLAEMVTAMPEAKVMWERHEPDMLMSKVKNGELDAIISYLVNPSNNTDGISGLWLADRATLLCVCQLHKKAGTTPLTLILKMKP